MTDLPAPVSRFLHEDLVRAQNPAYLLLDEASRLLEWGGPVELYGIADLERGAVATDHVPFLEGMIPVDTSERLQQVLTEGGTAADVDVVRSDEGTWVILRNTTWTVQHERELQQSRNTLRLLEEQIAKKHRDLAGSDGSITETLLAALGIAVLEPAATGGFYILGYPPAWLMSLWPEALGSPKGFRPRLDSPFIANFLVEAHEAWAAGRTLPSGPWSETDRAGQELHLEAWARTLGERRLLTIVEVGGRVSEKRELLQRAREQALGHQVLLKEIEKKDVLLHSIVHDLRTPMISAHAALQLLAAEELPAKTRQHLVLGRSELERQDLLIRSILDVFAADLDAVEQLPPDAAPVDLLDCTRDVVDSFAPVFSLRGLKAEFDSNGPPANWDVFGEQARLTRVLANLLDNAVRHSKPGAVVRVGLSLRDEDAMVAVEDEGPGVPKSFVPQLFDRFAQTGKAGNAGIGLHFCRITIESWGGRIGYEPRSPTGSRFWFRLPRRSAQQGPREG